MKYKEVKEYYNSGQLEYHYYEDENGHKCGECRYYHEDGKLQRHYMIRVRFYYGEVKTLNTNGTLRHLYLKDGDGIELATVIEYDKPSTHTEEQLIQIAKEHNLPLLSELPKTEAERTLWNLKHPDLPLLSIESE